MNKNNSQLSQRKNIKGIILFVVYLVVAYGLIIYLKNNIDLIEKVVNAPKWIVLTCFITSIIGIFLNGYLDITCAKVYGIHLALKDVMVFTFIATACNLILPLQMGSVIKAVYYKKKMHLNYLKYISIVSGTTVVRVIFYFVALLFSLGLLIFEWNLDKKYIISVLIIFGFGMFLLYLILRYQTIVLNHLPIKEYSRPIMQGFFELMNDRRTVLECLLNYLLLMILSVIRFRSIFECLGINVGMIDVLLYSSLYYAANIMPILPGNIGVSEAVMGITNMILSSDFDTGMNVVLISRIYYYIVVAIGALCMTIPAWRMYKFVADSDDENH